jgi:hypothetical protein
VNTQELQREREARFVEGMRAFAARDFQAIAREMRPDVVIAVPGESWISGSFAGYDSVGRCLSGLRRALESKETVITFSHEGDEMLVRHEITVLGPTHDVTMLLGVRLRFDADGKTAEIWLEPSDVGLFDHVVNSILRGIRVEDEDAEQPAPTRST